MKPPFRSFLQNKLWRDKMIEKAEQQGSRLDWHRLDDAAYDQQLRLKLAEEAAEVVAAKNSQELIAELADVYEAIDCLIQLHHLSEAAIRAAQAAKNAERGGFAERKFVTVAHHPEGSYLEAYCRAQPEKYPEINE